jgi:hypothetical protein
VRVSRVNAPRTCRSPPLRDDTRCHGCGLATLTCDLLCLGRAHRHLVPARRRLDARTRTPRAHLLMSASDPPTHTTAHALQPASRTTVRSPGRAAAGETRLRQCPRARRDASTPAATGALAALLHGCDGCRWPHDAPSSPSFIPVPVDARGASLSTTRMPIPPTQDDNEDQAVPKFSSPSAISDRRRRSSSGVAGAGEERRPPWVPHRARRC